MYDDILDVEFWAGHASAQNYKSKGSYRAERAAVHLFVDGHQGEIAVCGFKGHIEPLSLTLAADYYPKQRLCKNCISTIKFSRKMADALMLLRGDGHYGELASGVYVKLSPSNSNYAHSSRGVGRGNQMQYKDPPRTTPTATLKEILDDPLI
jgi:hypothetical protein